MGFEKADESSLRLEKYLKIGLEWRSILLLGNCFKAKEWASSSQTTRKDGLTNEAIYVSRSA